MHESEEAEIIFKSQNAVQITQKLLYITFHYGNWIWVQEKCLELLNNEDKDVRRLAVTCLGHLARIRKKLNKERVLKAFEEKKNDPTLIGRIEDALDDIEIYLKEI